MAKAKAWKPVPGTRQRSPRRIRRAWVGIVTGLILLGSAGAARAADRIYWANLGGTPTISFANLDGSGGGGSLDTTGATSGGSGLALDPSHGKVFSGSTGLTISFASLDGSGGGGDLNTGGAPVSSAQGVAVDPTAGRIYWSNSATSQGIFFANLYNTGGGGQLNTMGATVSSPIGVAVDSAGGRIYWANAAPTNKISFANLDGSGGGDINTTGATVVNPQGVALDLAAGRIYWANVFGQKISFANLDGSGGGDLNTTGATVNNPAGVALDAADGKIYWASVLGGKVSFARLDNSGGGDLDTAGAATNFPNDPVLLKAPVGTTSPQINGAGQALGCSQGGWSDGLIASFLYRAPSGFAYQWSTNGSAVGGANANSFAPPSAGHYSCTVTASNPAGSAAQTSDPFAYFTIGRARRNTRRGTAKLPLTLPDPGSLTVTVAGAKVSRTGSVAGGTVKLQIKASGRKRHKLRRTGRANLMLSIAYSPVGFAPSTQTTDVRLRKLP
jgi:DNA-binding beta-propeller fold protein YncE